MATIAFQVVIVVAMFAGLGALVGGLGHGGER